MSKMSKEKGKVGEREVAHLLQTYGFSARRGQQFAGGTDSPDVIHGIHGLHIEVKRTEQFNLWAALQQATDDAREGEVPSVWHRKNKREWVVVLRAEDFLEMLGGKKV